VHAVKPNDNQRHVHATKNDLNFITTLGSSGISAKPYIYQAAQDSTAIQMTGTKQIQSWRYIDKGLVR
jgi:hypothetical protein